MWNTLKTGLLLTSLTLLLVAIGGLVGGRGGMMMALIFAGIMNFVSYFFSDKIVLKMYKAQEADENSYPDLYEIVRGLARKGELPMPKVYVINNSQPNAFATGRNPKHAVVAVTTGIMSILDEDELSGVVAHELGHVKNRDILIGTMVATIAGAISMLATMARWGAMFGGGSDDDDGVNPIALLLISIITPIAALVIQMAISRAREYKADEFGGKLCGNPIYLAQALKKLQMGSRSNGMHATQSTSHLFIVNPLKGKGLEALFSTHPAIDDRVEKLENMSRSF